jgi:hypothetical protein
LGHPNMVFKVYIYVSENTRCYQNHMSPFIDLTPT